MTADRPMEIVHPACPQHPNPESPLSFAAIMSRGYPPPHTFVNICTQSESPRYLQVGDQKPTMACPRSDSAEPSWRMFADVHSQAFCTKSTIGHRESRLWRVDRVYGVCCRRGVPKGQKEGLESRCAFRIGVGRKIHSKTPKPQITYHVCEINAREILLNF